MKKYVLLSLVLMCTSPAFADLYCSFNPTNAAPSSFFRYSPLQQMVTTVTGWPAKTMVYLNAVIVKNADKSATIKVFGDVPVITVRYTGNAKIWYDMNEATYPILGTWEPKFPGGPAELLFGPQPGGCWTDKKPKVEFRQGRNH